MHIEFSLHCRSSPGVYTFQPSFPPVFLAPCVLFYTPKAIARLRSWGRCVPGVVWGWENSLGKRVLPTSSRWQLLFWLMMPLIPTNTSSGQPRLEKSLIPARQVVTPWPLNSCPKQPLPCQSLELAWPTHLFCQSWIPLIAQLPVTNSFQK